MNFKFVVLCALALMAGSAVYGQDNVIDEVVWVVGDEAILKSEVEEARMSALHFQSFTGILAQGYIEV